MKLGKIVLKMNRLTESIFDLTSYFEHGGHDTKCIAPGEWTQHLPSAYLVSVISS